MSINFTITVYMPSNVNIKMEKYWKGAEESNIVLISGTVPSLSLSY
jgi:hypothetical protein